MNLVRSCLVAGLACLAASVASADATATREDSRVIAATAVLNDWEQIPEQGIPDRLLERAQGIAVFPSVIKGALLVGARFGRGVVVVKDANGRWSDPAFITLTGGSFGLQFGIQAADIILVFTTRRGIEGLSGGKVTIGVDVGGAVGPVGRQMSGSTDIGLSEIYSYSQAKGLFAGISLDGSPMAIDHSANDAYYGQSGLLASDIFSGRVQTSRDSARALQAAVARLVGQVPAAAGAAPAAAGPGAPAQPVPPRTEDKGLESGGAATFPLEPAK